MQRAIYIVEAKVVNSAGTLGNATGYPKTFDSNSYDGDIVKTLRRARAAYHAALADFYAVDNRQLQSAYIILPSGSIISSESDGFIADVPDAEAENE